MDEKDRIAPEPRSTEPETPITSRGISPGVVAGRSEGKRPPRQVTTEPKRLEIVVRVSPVEPQQSEPPKPVAEVAAEPTSVLPAATEPVLTRPTGDGKVAGREVEPQQIPARMLNEFVYCQRLFYYEFVEGVFVESADTLRGAAIHQRVDTGAGALPAARVKGSAANSAAASGDSPDASSAAANGKSEIENEVIHSRSVQMGSERLGVVAKMDLVEVRAGLATGAARANEAEKEDLFTALEVCPVDYKTGSPKEGEEANELWDTDKMQLGLQALILRDNGYTCNEGIV